MPSDIHLRVLAPLCGIGFIRKRKIDTAMETIVQQIPPLLTIHWQPIETAPKDGTHFIGVVQGYVPSEAHWDDKNEVWIDDGEEVRNSDVTYGEWNLTHWIPMPEFW